jgi:LuxR family transcriptional regulator, maltose regulon positive regulatory protein
VTEPGPTSLRSDPPLMAAKYTVPPSRPGGVTRSRLHEQLLRNGGTRLTTVVAPAGWGKTTLLSHWANDPAEHRRVAWVSLDPSDDEPTRFWTYALAALGQHGVGTAARQALSAPGLQPVDVVLPVLLNELQASTERHILVLDDYHVLSNPDVQQGVEFLLTYLPPALHLVLAARADPPLSLPRMRARGQLTEIRLSELGFSPAEAGALITSVAAVDLDAPTARLLQERTEGWAAGLQLTALTLQGRSEPAAAVAEIRGDDRHILDFFSTEVLNRLTPDQRELLVSTSVLERLSGPLCDAALDRSGTAAVLADLDRANLFVVALDDHRTWYRCHRLFRDALRVELDRETAASILGRAADWFIEQDLVEDAIFLKIEAGDTHGAMELIKRAAPWFLEHGAAKIVHLAGRLPAEAVRSDPNLCGSLAWAAALAGQFHRIGSWLDAAEGSSVDDSDSPYGWCSLSGCVATLRSVQMLATSPGPDSIRFAERGAQLESDPTLSGYVLARHVLGTSYLADGRPELAVPVLEDARQRARDPRFPPMLGLQAACSLAVALFQTGRFTAAQRVCDESAPAVRLVEAAWGDAAALGIARVQMVQARLALRSGDLDTANRLGFRAVTLSKVWGLPSQVVLALTALAEVKLALGDLPAARRSVAEAQELVASEPIWPFVARELDEVDARIGRGAMRAAHPSGVLVEDLTDRELTLVRMLPGTANQREIAAALYLSINTVKGYAKSLYRKLDVSTRQEAVQRARELNLI